PENPEDSDDSYSELPEFAVADDACFQAVGHQAGGHVEFLHSPAHQGLIFKPVTPGEEGFYRSLPASLARFTCRCFGRCCIPPEQIDAQAGKEPFPTAFLVLEDLTEGLAEAAVADLKLGFRQRAPHHNSVKRESMMRKCAESTSAIVGFRLCGMRYYDPSTGEMTAISKQDCRRESEASLQQKLQVFFCPVPEQEGLEEQTQMMDVIQELDALSHAASNLPGWRFWGASLLVARDARPFLEGHGKSCIRMRLIDFTNFHRVAAEDADGEFLGAIHNVRLHLELCLRAPSGYVELPLVMPNLTRQDEEQVQAAADRELLSPMSAP
ncbi:Ip6k2, partial [Symbiodinium pilosum]